MITVRNDNYIFQWDKDHYKMSFTARNSNAYVALNFTKETYWYHTENGTIYHACDYQEALKWVKKITGKSLGEIMVNY